MRSKVAVLSVPHSGTHSTFNALSALGWNRRHFHNPEKDLGEVLHTHFVEENDSVGKIQDLIERADGIIVPLRSPLLTFISKYKRLVKGSHKAPLTEALGYTLGNWYTLGKYLPLNDALVVEMDDGIIPLEIIAEYMGFDRDLPPVPEVGNMIGESPSTKDELFDIPGGEIVPIALTPCYDVWDDIRGDT